MRIWLVRLDAAGGATAARPEAAHGRAFADGGFLHDKGAAVHTALLCVLRIGDGGLQRGFHQPGGLTRNQRHGVQRRDGRLPLDQSRDLTSLEGRNPHILGNGDFFHLCCVWVSLLGRYERKKEKKAGVSAFGSRGQRARGVYREVVGFPAGAQGLMSVAAGREASPPCSGV